MSTKEKFSSIGTWVFLAVLLIFAVTSFAAQMLAPDKDYTKHQTFKNYTAKTAAALAGKFSKSGGSTTGNISIGGSSTPSLTLSPSAANKDYSMNSTASGFTIRDNNSAVDRLTIDQTTGRITAANGWAGDGSALTGVAMQSGLDSSFGYNWRKVYSYAPILENTTTFTTRTILYADKKGPSVRFLFQCGPNHSLTVHAARFSLGDKAGNIVAGTDQPMTFDNYTNLTMSPNTSRYCDNIMQNVTSGNSLIATVYTSGTVHGRQYIYPAQRENGNQTRKLTTLATTLLYDTATAGAGGFPCYNPCAAEVLTHDMPAARTVYAMGDSITEGQYGLPASSWAHYVDTNLDVVLGATASNAAYYEVATFLPNRFKFGVKYDAQFLNFGSNDIANGRTSAQLEDDLSTIISTSKAMGTPIVLTTIIPRSFTGTQAQYWNETNTWIKSNPGGCGVYDFNSVVADPANPNQILAAYDYGDHVHPNVAGAIALAASFGSKVTTSTYIDTNTITSPATAQNLYVNYSGGVAGSYSAGSDTLNTGLSLSSPFKTVDKALSAIAGQLRCLYTIYLAPCSHSPAFTIQGKVPSTNTAGITLQGTYTNLVADTVITSARNTTSASALATVIVRNAGWTANVYQRKQLYVTSGTGAGQHLGIAFNTASSITVPFFKTALDTTSHIVVQDWGTLIPALVTIGSGQTNITIQDLAVQQLQFNAGSFSWSVQNNIVGNIAGTAPGIALSAVNAADMMTTSTDNHIKGNIFIGTTAQGVKDVCSSVILYDNYFYNCAIGADVEGGNQLYFYRNLVDACTTGVTIKQSGTGIFNTSKNVISNSTTALDISQGGIPVNENTNIYFTGNTTNISNPGYYEKGTATLSSGTVTVSNTKVTANSRIVLTSNGTGVAIGAVYEDKTNRTAGTSFIIKSTNVADSSTVDWTIYGQ